MTGKTFPNLDDMTARVGAAVIPRQPYEPPQLTELAKDDPRVQAMGQPEGANGVPAGMQVVNSRPATFNQGAPIVANRSPGILTPADPPKEPE